MLLTDREPGKLAGCVERVIRIPDEWESLLAGASEMDFDWGRVTENDLAGLFYTGGTTGASKGVMLSHRNLIANTWHWISAIPHQRDRLDARDGAALPRRGLEWRSSANIWTGGKQVMPPGVRAGRGPRSDRAARQCTGTIGVPTMLSAIAEEQLARSRASTDSMRWIAHGGSPIASRRFLERVHEAIPSAELDRDLRRDRALAARDRSPAAEEKLFAEDRIRSCGPGGGRRLDRDPGRETDRRSAAG